MTYIQSLMGRVSEIEMFSVWRVFERLVREKANTLYWGVTVGSAGIAAAKSTGALPSTEKLAVLIVEKVGMFATMKNT